MSVRLVHRPARIPPPPVRREPIGLATPPRLGDGSQAWGWYTYLFPVLGAGGALAFVLVNPNPIFLIGGLVFILGAGGMGVALFLQQRGRGRSRLDDQRRRYLAHLDIARATLREAAERQRANASWRHPEPAALPAVVHAGERLWERRPADADHAVVRVGRGRVPLLAAPAVPDNDDPLREWDPVCHEAARRLVTAHGLVDDVPLAIDLRERAVCSIVGTRSAGRALLRAMVGQIAALHAPGDVRIAVLADPDALAQWEWIKWLPHAQHPESRDPSGPRPLITDSLEGFERLLGAELAQRSRRRQADGRPNAPHLLVVVDCAHPLPIDHRLVAFDHTDVTVLALADHESLEPSRVDLRLRLDDGDTGGLLVADTRADAPGSRVIADRLSLPAARALARRLAGLRLRPDATDVLRDSAGLSDLLGVDDVAALDPVRTWAPRDLRDQLRVPIGVGSDGQLVHLDLKESALEGMGPHGLVVGATGSGKSELLRTLVTALAIGHPPDELAFVLVDYKGGATFAGLSPLPHVAGVITNLEDDPTMVDRMHQALYAEIHRRERLLREAGNLSNIREYRKRRRSAPALEALPSLVVIVDEFSELLADKPDFIDMFVAIGRLGRSLGMHLLLASQRLEEGRLRGLESHLSYRIALRTFSAAESRIVLGTPDAYELPPTPGSAYLKVDTTVYERLRTAMVSSPYVEPAELLSTADRAEPVPFAVIHEAGSQSAPSPAFTGDVADPDRRSIMDVAIGRLSGAAAPVHQVWLPPLGPVVALDALIDTPDEAGSRVGGQPASLSTPIGVIDVPDEQRQERLVIDLSGAAGHLAVAGGPQTGKSTMLRTLLLSFACSHTAAQTQFYCLDFGGGLLAAMEGLPHVGAVAGRLEPELVRRVVNDVIRVLEHRERYFPTQGIDSVRAFRTRHAQSGLVDDDYGDVFLVIDNWAVVRQDFEDLEPLVQDIASRGLGYGIHVILTAGRWLDIRPKLFDTIGARIELPLAEPADSVIDRPAARALPDDVPGRAIIGDGLQVQLALPWLDHEIADVDEALATAVRQIADAAVGPPAPQVRLLPTAVTLRDLPAVSPSSHGVPIGLAETDLAPVHLDLFGPDPHFVVLGDGEAGKTSFLRMLLAGLTAQRSARDLRVLVVDYRRTLLDAVDDHHLLAYAGSPTAARDMIGELAAKMRRRLPGSDVTAAQLRTRSWWTGPEALFVVDDYDLVTGPSGNPLEPLTEFIPQARDLGLHVVIARRVGGMARAGYETFLRRLVELHSPGLIMSGSRDEGPLLDGQRATPQVAGRGLLVHRRDRPVLVQTTWLPPDEQRPTLADDDEPGVAQLRRVR